MALSYSTLVKPTSKQLIDPDTGEIRKDWDLYLKGLTERLNATIDEVVALPAPSPLDAQYIVGTADATLTAERVATNSTSNTWNLGTPGQASVQRAALTGDVAASANSNTTTIQPNSVSFSKMQDITTDRLIGRDTASSGDPEEISVGGGLEFTGSGGIQRSALTGDVAATAGSNSTTIQNDAVTYAKLQNVSATSRIIGRKTASSGDAEECTPSEVLDFIGSAAHGDILYRGASSWARLPAGTSGQYLKTLGATNLAWDTPRPIAYKTGNQTSTNSTTFVDIADLSFPVGTTGNYYFKSVIFFDAPATPDIKFQVTGPSGGSGGQRIAHYAIAGGATAFSNIGVDNSYSVTIAVLGAGTSGSIYFDGFIQQGGGTAGSVKIQFAQNTANLSASTVYAGSWLEYAQVS